MKLSHILFFYFTLLTYSLPLTGEVSKNVKSISTELKTRTDAVNGGETGKQKVRKLDKNRKF